jgi:hypothetical protein
VICRASHSAVGCRVSPLWDGQHYPAARIGVLPLNSRTMRERSESASDLLLGGLRYYTPTLVLSCRSAKRGFLQALAERNDTVGFRFA